MMIIIIYMHYLGHGINTVFEGNKGVNFYKLNIRFLGKRYVMFTMLKIFFFIKIIYLSSDL